MEHGEIQNYLVPVNLIEAMAGLDFFPDLHNAEWEDGVLKSTWEKISFEKGFWRQ